MIYTNIMIMIYTNIIIIIYTNIIIMIYTNVTIGLQGRAAHEHKNVCRTLA